MHPKDRPSALTRRSLLARAGGRATAGAGASLAGCENTTTPVAVAGAARRRRAGSSATRPRAARSTRRASRWRGATTRSRCRASASRVAPASSPSAAASCTIYNYADYLNPAVLKAFGKQEGVSVRVTTFETLDEAFSKLSSGRLDVRRDLLLARPALAARRAQAHPAAQLRPGPEPEQQRLAASCTDPFYDVGPRYSVPYTVYTTGIGWRKDQLGFDPPSSTSRGTRSGRPRAYTRPGRRARRLARGAGHGADAPRRDRPQHRGARAAATRRGATCRSSNELVRVKVVDLRVRDAARRARSWLHQSWSGDLISAVISYLPKGTSPERARLLVPGCRAARSSTTASASAPGATKPVIAHRFLNYLLDAKVAYDELRRLRRLPAAAERDRRPDQLFDGGHRPQSAAPGGRDPRGLRQRQRVPDAVRPGPAAVGRDLGDVPQRLSVRLAHLARCSPLPGARLAGRVLPRRVLRDRRGRPRQRRPALPAGPALEPARLERRLHLARRSRTCVPGGRPGTSSCARSIYVAVARRAVAGHRLPRRLVRGAPRRALARPRCSSLLVLPFWISYLMRMFAWTNLLDSGGYATRRCTRCRSTRCCESLGLLDGSDWLGGQHVTVDRWRSSTATCRT